MIWDHPVVFKVMVGPGQFVDHAIPASWIPAAAFTGALTALMQGALLAWIIAEEFRQKPAPVIIRRPSVRTPQSTEPQSTQAGATEAGATEPGTKQSEATQPESKEPEAAALGFIHIPVFLSLIALLAVAPFGLMPNAPRMTAAVRADLQMLMLAAFSPWAIAFILLFPRQTRHLGLTLAAASSFILLVPFIVLAALTFGLPVVFWAFEVDPQAVRGTTVALLATAILATHAAFKTPASERLIWAWPVSVIVPLAIGYATFTVLTIPMR